MFAFSLRKFFWGILVVAIGLLIWAHNYGLVALSFHFSRDWPVLMVAAGLMSVWGAVFGRQWWSGHRNCSHRERIPGKARKILEDLESGEISAEEAAEKLDEE
jgi:hypothetical protein